MITKMVSPALQSKKSLHSPLATTQTVAPDHFKLNPATKRLVNILLHQYLTVRLVQSENDTVLIAHLVDPQRVFVGRGNTELKEYLDIDLRGYGGREKGVSRLHATLHRVNSTLSIVDLNSSNGTFYNGVRLLPGQPRFLQSGDEVCFGNMRFHIHFGW